MKDISCITMLSKDIPMILVVVTLFASITIGSTFTVTSPDDGDSGGGTAPLEEIILTVETDQQHYYQGEEVIISGIFTYANGSVPPWNPVCIEIRDPNNVGMGLCIMPNQTTGYYRFPKTIAPDAMLGVYTINASIHFYDPEYNPIYNFSVNTTFEVVSATVNAEAYGSYEGMVDQPIEFYLQSS